MPLHKGDIIGAYEIIAPLGQGGMATVYKAYHARLNRFVAIKMIHQAFIEDTSYIARFEREAQIVAALEHPHIVPVYDFSEFEGEPYLVMKLIEGKTLKALMSESKLPVDEILNIAASVGDALDYAHSRGVLHRDVKPSNIILDKQAFPYLSDFGLARLSISGASTMSMDFMIGTPYYMSPEQAQGKAEIDSRADLYSFGVVLYELFVGQVPFSEGTPYAIINDHMMRELPLPSSINPDIPKRVELVLLRALAKDPDDRYQTAAEMIAAMRQAVKAEAPSMAVLSEGRQSAIISLAKMPPPVPEMTPMLATTPPAAAPATRQGKKTEPIKQEASKPQPKAKTVQTKPAPKSSSHVVELALLAVSLVLVLVLVAFLVLRNQNTASTAIPTLIAQQPTVLITLASQPTVANPTPVPFPTQAPTLPLDQSGQGQNPPPNGNPGQPPSQPTQGQQNGAQGQSGLPPTIPVPNMTEAQARDAISHKASDPVPYLALIQTELQAGQDTAAYHTFTQGLANTSLTIPFDLTAANLAVQTANYGDAFLFYSKALEDAENQPPYAAVRAAAGQFLYSEATLAGKLSISEIRTLAGELVSNKSPIVSAMIGRAFLTGNLPVLAETSINQALKSDSTLAEAHLVNGEYELAQGDKTQARDEWQLALNDTSAPQWVTDRINQLLSANPQ